MKHQYCPNYSVSLTTTDEDEDNPLLVYRARCKQWGCVYCAEINARVWRARLMLEVQRFDDDWYFWTLTLAGCHHDGDVAKSLQVWREKWDKLLKRVRRDLGKLRYVRVFETHKDGTLHVHMLCDQTYLDVKCHREADGRENWRSAALKRHLAALGLGWRHDLKPIVTTDRKNDGNARNVSAYVTKYLTKDIQSAVRDDLREAGMGRVRMIQTTRGWAKVPSQAKKREWEVGGLLWSIYDKAIEDGVTVEDVDAKRAIKPSDFHGQHHYPNKYTDLADLGDVE